MRISRARSRNQSRTCYRSPVKTAFALTMAVILLASCGSPAGSSRTGNLWVPGGRWVSVSNEPSAQIPTVMVWNGSELLLWGGVSNVPVAPPTAPGGGYPPGYPGYTGTPASGGFSYNPRQHRWASIPPAPLPFLGFEVSSAWTGHDMIVWGFDETARNRSIGALYNPATKKWTAMADQSMVAVGTGAWTGSEWIVVGEDHTSTHVHAMAYQPATNTWRTLPDPPTLNGPRQGQVVTWTGKTLLFGIPFGLDHAIAYDPSANRWNALAPSPAGKLTESTVAWTGDYLVLTGGSQVPPGSDVGTPVHITALYNPATNTWTRASQPPHPVNTGIPVDNRALFPGQPTLAYDPTSDTWSTFPTPPGSTTIWTGQDLWSIGINRSDRKSVVLYRYQPKQ